MEALKHYFGISWGNELICGGIEIRRHDASDLIKEIQTELHYTIFECKDSAEVISKGYDNALLHLTKTIDKVMTGEIQVIWRDSRKELVGPELTPQLLSCFARSVISWLRSSCLIHHHSDTPRNSKTMFLTSLMRLKNSYFADGANSTKAGMIDYLFENWPRYLLVDEIDKMYSKDQAFLLNLMETGIVSETNYGKTRSAQINTSVFDDEVL